KNNSAPIETDSCEHLRQGSQVHFRIRVKLLKCPPADQSPWQIVRIAASGLDDHLTLRIRMRCDCDCEELHQNKQRPDSNSTALAKECNNAGYLRCGLCKCGSNNYGRQCECRLPDETSDLETSPASITAMEREDACR